MLKALWNTVLDILYPPKCPGCRVEVEVHGSWCATCLADFFEVREINIELHHLSHLDYCLAVCEYTRGVKRVIHDIKFRGAEKKAPCLQWLLGQGVSPAQFAAIDIVIPVPLHPERRKERGYNQSELIFKEWVIKQGWRWSEDNLIRSKLTQPQWELKLNERRKNIKDAFSLTHPYDIAGKSILLVDDIITTGTTINECAKILKSAGAVRVRALALSSGAPY